MKTRLVHIGRASSKFPSATKVTHALYISHIWENILGLFPCSFSYICSVLNPFCLSECLIVLIIFQYIKFLIVNLRLDPLNQFRILRQKIKDVQQQSPLPYSKVSLCPFCTMEYICNHKKPALLTQLSVFLFLGLSFFVVQSFFKVTVSKD